MKRLESEFGSLTERVVGGVAHKLRNDLNSLRAHVMLAGHHCTPDVPAQIPVRLGLMDEAITRMAATIDSLELVCGRLPSTPDLIDLNVRLVHWVPQDELENEGIAVAWELASWLPQTELLEHPLEMAVRHLVDNSRAAMEHGGTLWVRTKALPRGWLLLELEDTGCGIPAEQRPAAFAPLVTSRKGACGLGLAIVQRGIKACHGRVSLHSGGKGGTLARVLLPSRERMESRQLRKQCQLPWRQTPTANYAHSPDAAHRPLSWSE